MKMAYHCFNNSIRIEIAEAVKKWNGVDCGLYWVHYQIGHPHTRQKYEELAICLFNLWYSLN